MQNALNCELLMSYYGDTDYGWIYILEDPETKYLKIGYTKNHIKDRKRQLSKIHSKILKEVHREFVEDPRCVETIIHEYFCDCRHPGEFFDIKLSDLLTFINEKLDVVDYQEWEAFQLRLLSQEMTKLKY